MGFKKRLKLNIKPKGTLTFKEKMKREPTKESEKEEQKRPKDSLTMLLPYKMPHQSIRYPEALKLFQFLFSPYFKPQL